ncbi:MAG: haloacid dehalogenase [Acidobacteria bacterium]|nr:MAG: haloacid dehalogenase [Acidobacteriota bacterium]
MKLLLFNVDQTLIYTGGAGLRALDRACRKHLAVENATEGISAHGKTDPAIIREILLARVGSDSTLEIQLQSILESYLLFLREEVQLSPGYRVLPGIVEILREMSAQTGVVIGLATGNVEVGARIKLDRGNLNPYFTFGGFGSDSENRTTLVKKAADAAVQKCGSAIEPEDIFVIGDTPRDIEAGKDAGFRTVGVATGNYSLEQLRTAGANIAISDFQQGHDHFLRSAFME